MMINIITIYSDDLSLKKPDSYHKGREGGGQRVMIEIIISENAGWHLSSVCDGRCLMAVLHPVTLCMYMQKTAVGNQSILLVCISGAYLHSREGRTHNYF